MAKKNFGTEKNEQPLRRQKVQSRVPVFIHERRPQKEKNPTVERVAEGQPGDSLRRHEEAVASAETSKNNLAISLIIFIVFAFLFLRDGSGKYNFMIELAALILLSLLGVGRGRRYYLRRRWRQNERNKRL